MTSSSHTVEGQCSHRAAYGQHLFNVAQNFRNGRNCKHQQYDQVDSTFISALWSYSPGFLIFGKLRHNFGWREIVLISSTITALSGSTKYLPMCADCGVICGHMRCQVFQKFRSALPISSCAARIFQAVHEYIYSCAAPIFRATYEYIRGPLKSSQRAPTILVRCTNKLTRRTNIYSRDVPTEGC